MKQIPLCMGQVRTSKSHFRSPPAGHSGTSKITTAQCWPKWVIFQEFSPQIELWHKCKSTMLFTSYTAKIQDGVQGESPYPLEVPTNWYWRLMLSKTPYTVPKVTVWDRRNSPLMPRTPWISIMEVVDFPLTRAWGPPGNEVELVSRVIYFGI